MKRLLIVLAAWLTLAVGGAQELQTWEDVEDFLLSAGETYTEEDGDQLLQLYQNPIELNTADSLTLSELPFLTSEQVSAILKYRDQTGDFLSTSEVVLIPKLNRLQITLLPLFTQCGAQPKQKQVIKQEAALAASYPFYTRAGYTNESYDYPGSKLQHTLRYKISIGDTWAAGINIHKDDGEKDWADDLKMFVMYQSKGWLKQVVVGNFQARFGQGLVVGNATSTSVLTSLNTYRYRESNFKPQTATSQSKMQRGAAVALMFGPVQLRLFGAYNELDATVDTTGTVSAIYTTGYHRTLSERKREGKLHQTVGGMNLLFHHKRTNISLSLLGGHYGHPIKHYTDYRYYRMHGQDFANASIAYSTAFASINLEGEVGTSSFGGVASTHTLKWRPTYGYVFLAQHRLITCRYVAPLSNTHTLASQVQDEHGLSLACRMEIGKRHALTGYIDAAYHEKPTYYCFGASTQGKAQLQYDLQASTKTSFTFRYQYTLSQRDIKDQLLKRHTHKHTLRLQANYALWILTMKTAVDFGLYRSQYAKNSWGKLLSHRIILRRDRCTFNLYGALFDTDDYNSRLYSYSPRLTYVGSSSLRYGRGFVVSATAEYKLARQLSLGARFEVTHYTDRDVISSADRQINHSTRSDLSLQLRYSL